EEVVDANLVIGSVLIPGAKTPKLITRARAKLMKPGAAFIDIAIDQGGCAETSRPTTLLNPIYVEEEVVHYCVTNMPAIVPNTSTYALTNSTLSYGLQLANRGFPQALARNPALAKGLNTYGGKVTHEGVANAFNLPWTPAEEVIPIGRSGSLLRDQHAGHRAKHIDLRSHQFNAFLRFAARQ